jgi:hypothetical protein
VSTTRSPVALTCRGAAIDDFVILDCRLAFGFRIWRLRRPAYCLLPTAYLFIRIDGQLDGVGVRPGRNHEIVFQFSLVAVIHEVHAGIDVGILHPRVVGHVGAPFLGVIADEVVALAWQFLEAADSRVGTCSYQSHVQHRSRGWGFGVRDWGLVVWRDALFELFAAWKQNESL